MVTLLRAACQVRKKSGISPANGADAVFTAENERKNR